MRHRGQSITDKLAVGDPLVSVEFFPPKTEDGARQILRTAKAIQPYEPDFVSITYGAGGSTRERTLEYGELLADLFGFEVMPHLTCVGHSRDELRQIVGRFRKAGFRNIMTLRGDPPKGQSEFKVHPDGLRYANELVALIRQEFPMFCLGVAGYPEKHPEAPSLDADLAALRNKVACGADFITTQLFFDNTDYFRFVEKCRALGIKVPVIPGVMPALSLEQVERFCGFCGAKLPEELRARLAAVAGDEAAGQRVGIEWAHEQIQGLLDKGAPGFHLYILNRAQCALQLFERLRAEKLLPR